MKKINQEESFYRPIKIGENIYGSKSDFRRENFDKLIGLLGDSIKDKTILDLGAGAGGLSFELVNKGIKHSISVERGTRSESGEKLAKKNNITKIEFRRESIDDFFKQNNRNFDFIFFLNILHWLANPGYILDKAYECCNKSIIIETPRTIIKKHTNNYITDTYLNLYKNYSIKKYPRINSCDGPRDGLIIGVEKYKADKILYQRAEGWRIRPDRKCGSGGLVYKNIEEEIIIYKGKDKKKHKNPIKCRFSNICDLYTENIRNDGVWYMGDRSDKLINKYRYDMKNGDIFPPVLVYKDNGYFYIIDGSHRLEARRGHFRTINAIVLGVVA